MSEFKKVSTKKILFVDLEEELTKILERVEKLPYNDIYLVVPKRAVLLQSVVNLKILKQKLESLGKTLAIITNDPSGMKLAHQAEIKVFDQYSMGASEVVKKDPSDGSALLSPIAASTNDVSDLLPSRLPRKKSSIFEVVKEMRKQGETPFSIKNWIKKRAPSKEAPWQIDILGGNRRFIAGILITAFAIFAVIAYTVLPGATLYIEPASDVITRGSNIMLVKNPNEPLALKAYTIKAEVEVTHTHSASGFVNNGANASGTVTISNTSNVAQPLIKTTRIQTDDGIVFRIQKDVTVPRGTTEAPGTVEVEVIADAADANGVPIGSRGNIEPTRMFLPGLKEESRDRIYAENKVAFTGGSSDVTPIVTEDDLVAARDKLESLLKEKALASLRKEVLSEGNQLGLNLRLLEDADALRYGVSDIQVPYEMAGKELKDFEIKGTLTLSGVAYDGDALLDILKNVIVAAETPGKQLVRINEESISISVLDANPDNNTYKFTAEIQGIEEYEIDPQYEGGNALVKKIKEHIAGRSVEEASQYIQNLPEVNKVEIKVWPRWSPTIPTLPENIRIRSVSQGDAVEDEAEKEE